MADPFMLWLAQQDQGGLPAPLPATHTSNPYQQMNGSQTRAAGSMGNISPGPPVGTTPVPLVPTDPNSVTQGQGSMPGVTPLQPLTAQEMAAYLDMQMLHTPTGAGTLLPTGGATQTNVPGMPGSFTGIPLGGATQYNVPGMPMNPNGTDPRFPFVTPDNVNPYASSQLPVNESVINANIWDNPQMALLLSGFVDPGTPGYNNLANLGFDPLAVYYASGGSPSQSTGTDYAQWLMNMYTTLGTRADQGGGSITAGPLLQNLVNMPKDSELWKMMRDDPTVFYTMATSVMEAGGMSPMAQSSFKSQMAQLYTEYLTYTATVPKEGDTMVISDWIRTKHPEVVASWGGGG